MPAPRRDILLVNLGTPHAPTPQAARRYLRQFLSDRRVVELPRALWLPLLYGIILPLRARRSAAKYAAIWQAEGSPLRIHTEALVAALQHTCNREADEALPGRADPHSLSAPADSGDLLTTNVPAAGVFVTGAMRYGRPDIASQLRALCALGCEEILYAPLYPQYAAATTGSALDALARVIPTLRRVPAIHTLAPFPDHPAYLAVLAQRVRTHWQAVGRGEHLLLSFHGLPQRCIDRGDPYAAHCQRTVSGLVRLLGLQPGEYSLSYQSRFGRSRWLGPVTHSRLTELGRQRIPTVDVICPGFVTDCLETLEEIVLVGARHFRAAGGGELRYIPALNAGADWVAALRRILMEAM